MRAEYYDIENKFFQLQHKYENIYGSKTVCLFKHQDRYISPKHNGYDFIEIEINGELQEYVPKQSLSNALNEIHNNINNNIIGFRCSDLEIYANILTDGGYNVIIIDDDKTEIRRVRGG
jgi:hypothetical protein